MNLRGTPRGGSKNFRQGRHLTGFRPKSFTDGPKTWKIFGALSGAPRTPGPAGQVRLDQGSIRKISAEDVEERSRDVCGPVLEFWERSREVLVQTNGPTALSDGVLPFSRPAALRSSVSALPPLLWSPRVRFPTKIRSVGRSGYLVGADGLRIFFELIVGWGVDLSDAGEDRPL